MFCHATAAAAPPACRMNNDTRKAGRVAARVSDESLKWLDWPEFLQVRRLGCPRERLRLRCTGTQGGCHIILWVCGSHRQLYSFLAMPVLCRWSMSCGSAGLRLTLLPCRYPSHSRRRAGGPGAAAGVRSTELPRQTTVEEGRGSQPAEVGGSQPAHRGWPLGVPAGVPPIGDCPEPLRIPAHSLPLLSIPLCFLPSPRRWLLFGIFSPSTPLCPPPHWCAGTSSSASSAASPTGSARCGSWRWGARWCGRGTAG